MRAGRTLTKEKLMGVPGAEAQIHKAVLAWEGVTAHPHRFGGTEYRFGRREIGHIHGNRLVDIPFPKKVRDEVIAAGQAEPHHVLPESGWVSCFLRHPDDIDRVISLLRHSFELAQQQRRQSGAQKDRARYSSD